MKPENLARKILLALASVLFLAQPMRALAEDIDIFISGQGGSSGANVLIVLDNTSNWASASQNWPGNEMQGQAELRAIASAVSGLDDSIRVGLMMFTNNGQGNCCNGGYMRYAMRPMTDTNKLEFQALLLDIVANFNDPENQAASSATPAMTMFDAFKYFGGYWNKDRVPARTVGPHAFDVDVFASPPSAYPASKADRKGYANDALTKYLPPESTDEACGGRNFIIYIGNGWEPSDTLPQQNMKTFLEAVGGDSTQIGLPVLKTVEKIGDSACYKDSKAGQGNCDTAAAAACDTTKYTACTCGSPTVSTGCSKGDTKYTITGALINAQPATTPPTYALPDNNKVRYADEWTRFLRKDADVSPGPGQQNVTTYTIDVFNAKPDADQTALLYSMATEGGGVYFSARSQAEIESALDSTFAQIRADNSTFASASLPVSATNRALNVNEVYMGVFRPDADRKPLWYGNLKRYKIKNFFGDYKLADINDLDAVDVTPNGGFLKECATSWWTNDSGNYWEKINIYPPALGTCPASVTSFGPYSDSPDGPNVAKGGVAQILRQGNVGAGTPTWTLNRTLRTKTFVDFTVANTGMTPVDLDFVRGLNMDTTMPAASAATTPFDYVFTDPTGTSRTTTIRSSIHGAVVHSRPLPVNYGGATGTVLYYGADDGMYRAVNAATGQEHWAYVPQEFYPTLPRLRANSPKVLYSFVDPVDSDPTPPTPKDYHFDGSTGLWQKADNSQVWIYPTMRRGGRMIYAFNVSNPSAPSLLWSKGCRDLVGDTNCDAGFSDIGQTWSTPNVAPVKDGSAAAAPMLIVGGGYDNCEDGSATGCDALAKGSVIFVLDAETGAIVQTFNLSAVVANPNERGRVVSDVALIDVDYDGIADFGYAGDTRGNLYRIGFGMSKTAPLAKASWTLTRVGHSSSRKHKFLNTPALVQGYDKATDKTYVYVALGSGDREQPLASQYPFKDPVRNSFYVLMDDVTGSTDTNLDDTSAMEDFTSDPGCGSNLVIPGSSKRGWFMDFPAANTGEQTVTSAVIVGGLVAFSTNAAVGTPENPNVCAPKGIARGYVVNLFNSSGGIAANDNACGGERSSEFVGGGLPPAPVVANVEVDGVVQTIVIGVADLKGRPSSPIQSEIGFTLKPQKRTRIYWRQEGNN